MFDECYQAWLDVEEEILQGNAPELEDEYTRMIRNQHAIADHRLTEINSDVEINACFELDSLERSSFR